MADLLKQSIKIVVDKQELDDAKKAVIDMSNYAKEINMPNDFIAQVEKLSLNVNKVTDAFIKANGAFNGEALLKFKRELNSIAELYKKLLPLYEKELFKVDPSKRAQKIKMLSKERLVPTIDQVIQKGERGEDNSKELELIHKKRLEEQAEADRKRIENEEKIASLKDESLISEKEITEEKEEQVKISEEVVKVEEKVSKKKKNPLSKRNTKKLKTGEYEILPDWSNSISSTEVQAVIQKAEAESKITEEKIEQKNIENSTPLEEKIEQKKEELKIEQEITKEKTAQEIEDEKEMRGTYVPREGEKKASIDSQFLKESIKTLQDLKNLTGEKFATDLNKQMSAIKIFLDTLEDQDGFIDQMGEDEMLETVKMALKTAEQVRGAILLVDDPELLKSKQQLSESISYMEEEIDELASKAKNIRLEDGNLPQKDRVGIFKESIKGTNLKPISAKSGNVLGNDSLAVWEKSYASLIESLEKVKNLDLEVYKTSAEYRAQFNAEVEKQLALDGLKIESDEIQSQLTIAGLFRAKEKTELTKRQNDLQNINNAISEKENEIKAERVKLTAVEEKLDDKQLQLTDEEGKALAKQSIEIRKNIQAKLDAVNVAKKQQIPTAVKLKEETKKLHEEVAKPSSWSQAAKNVFSYGLAFNFLKRIYRESINTIKELDHALTEMAIVTTMNRKNAWELIPRMQELAKVTGFTTTQVAELTTEYLKQGRSLSDSITLAEAAAKAARIAGISASESVSYLTAAINGFSLAADDAMSVSDKFAALAARSATDYEELAVGLSKFASQANVAGLSMDFALGLLAKGVETTREAPESIGTALKTVLSRMRELTDLGKTFEDGMSLNRVETALQQIGIQLRDSSGQFRDMQQVLTEVGMRWETLNKNQQASIAVSLAGTRQQSRLIAMFQDFDRTLQLVETSEDSAGATAAQHAEYMEGMQAALTGLQTAYQKFITTITDSELIISIINGIGNAIEFVANSLQTLGIFGKNAMFIIGALLVLWKSELILSKTRALWKNILILLQKKENAGILKTISLKIKETVATKLETAATWKAIAAKLAYNLLVLGIVVALAAATYATYKLIVADKERIKSLEKQNAKLANQRYELKQSVKEIDDLIKKIEELNANPIKTEESINELNSLISTLKEIKGLNIEFIPGTMNIDWDSILAQLKTLSDIEKNAARETYREQTENALDIMYTKSKGQVQLALLNERIQSKALATAEAKLKVETDPDRIKSLERQISLLKESMSYQEQIFKENASYFKEFANENKDTLTNFLIDQVSFEGMTEAHSNSLRKYFEDVIANGAPITNIADLYGIAEGSTPFIEQMVTNFSEMEKASKNSDDSFKAQIDTFIRLTDGMKETDVAYQILKDQFASAEYFASLKREGKDIVDIFEDMQMASEDFNDLASASKKAGLSIDEVISKIMQKKKEIMDNNPEIDSTIAQTMAYIEVAKTVSNVTLKTQLLGMSTVKTNQEIAQTVETLNTEYKRLGEEQKKILSGEMSAPEMYKFAQDFQEIFSNQNLFERFMRGEDVSLTLLQDNLEESRKYLNNLLAVEQQMIGLDSNSEEYKALLAQRNELQMLIAYTGELRNVTKEQYSYNKALQAYNKLKEAGIESDALSLELLRKAQIATAQTFKRNSDEIEQTHRDSIETLGGDYIDIVDGVAMISERALSELKGFELEALQDFVDSIQINLDEQLAAFKNIRDLEINALKEANDKKKKIYEDYFDSLDRIQEKRDREQSREDIVKQLQILEGATDEKSRQRAKELRQELNEMDKDSAKKSQEESRASLIESLDAEVEDAIEKWNQAGIDFVTAMSEGGATAGDAMIKVLQDAGLLPKSASGAGSGDNAYDPTKTSVSGGIQGTTQDGVGLAENTFGDIPVLPPPITPKYNWYDAFEKFMRFSWEKDANQAPSSFEAWKNDMIEKGLTPDDLVKKDNWDTAYNPTANYMIGGNMPNDKKGSFLEWWIDNYNSRFGLPIDYTSAPKGYRKGGIVDYTGIAQVHGSSGSPEAFLNASQTEMFSNLTKALSSISLDGTSKGAINIENITIQTQSLNNKQDFNSAGKVLAEAFNEAIGKRGIPVNSKR